MITNEEKQELKALAKKWFHSYEYNDRKTQYETEFLIEDTISNIIAKYDAKLLRSKKKKKSKKNIEDILDDLLKGKHHVKNFISSPNMFKSSGLYEEMNEELSSIHNYMIITAKNLSKKFNDNETWLQYVLLARYTILMGAISSKDDSIQKKLYSLARRL